MTAATQPLKNATHTPAQAAYNVHMSVYNDLDRILNDRETGLNSGDLARILTEEIAAAPETVMSRTTIDYLSEHGGPGVADAVAVADPDTHAIDAESAARRLAELLSSTIDINGAARRLGIDRSGVSRRLSRDQLWAITVGDRRRLPIWQFVDDTTLPGLAQIVPAIPDDVSPLQISARMETVDEDLGGRSLITYLIDGGDPAVAVDLIAALGQW